MPVERVTMVELSLWLTAGLRVLLGAFEAPYIPASVAAVARAIPSRARRGRFAAFMQSGAQLGPAAGVFFAGLILQATRSPTYIFIVFGVVGLAGAAAWWLSAKDFSDPRPQGAQAETNEAKERRASTDAASAAHYEPGIVAVLHRLFCTALLPIHLPDLAAAISHSLPEHSARDRKCAECAAFPGLFHWSELCRLGDGLVGGDGFHQGWLPPQIFRRTGRGDLCGDDTDCRDNFVNRGRGDNDRYRERRLGILCRAVLDDLHLCRAE